MNCQSYGLGKRMWRSAGLAASIMLMALMAHAQGAIEAVSASIQGLSLIHI